jgi:ligand-binding sensor domain-containing protein
MKQLIIVIIFFIPLVINSCEQPVSVSPPITAPGNKATIFIDSKPNGAKIYFDDEFTGHLTPDTVKWYDENVYKITLKLPYYKDSSLYMFLQENKILIKFVDFTANPTMYGSIRCATIPSGAAIILDDSLTNQNTPHTFYGILPGIHKLKFKLNGFWDGETIAAVYSNILANALTVSLVDTSVWVYYTTQRVPLTSDFINDIEIEDGSIKWIATTDGLIRFDDNSWLLFDSTNSPLLTNFITSIHINKKGEKWITTNSGLYLYFNDQWTAFNKGNSPLPSDMIYTVHTNEINDEVWIGTAGGLIIYKNGGWKKFSHPFFNYPISAIFIDPIKNEKWVGSVGAGIAKINYDNLRDLKIFTSYGLQIAGTDHTNANIEDIKIDRRGKIWAIVRFWGIASVSWLVQFDNDRSAVKGKGDYSRLAFDPGGNIWLSSFSDGFYKYEQGAFKHYKIIGTSSKVASFSIAVDDQNNKWIASYGAGLIKYKGN